MQVGILQTVSLLLKHESSNGEALLWNGAGILILYAILTSAFFLFAHDIYSAFYILCSQFLSSGLCLSILVIYTFIESVRYSIIEFSWKFP